MIVFHLLQAILATSSDLPSRPIASTTSALTSPLSSVTKPNKFPTNDLLPRVETTASSFVKSNPKYDGRGITIGILDTGIDPGAIGLASLPDDKGRKLVHVSDCTGAGDVDMSTESEAKYVEGKGWVIEKGGLLGQEIVLNPALHLKPFPVEKNTTKDDEDGIASEGEAQTQSTSTSIGSPEPGTTMPVRLGYKRAYEIFPKKLSTRVRKHRKSLFEEVQHRHAVDVRSQLSAMEAKISKNPTQEELDKKNDLQARLDILEGVNIPDDDLLKEDPGPLYQLIMFHDGEDYRVIVDTEMKGDLIDVPVEMAMTDYYKEGQYGMFSNVDMCNYAVNIYNGGKVASLVVDAGAHGSHVGGIAAAFFPPKDGSSEEGDANGVAPGAKLISLKIGDTRLGSMERGSALTRALIEAVKHKCDVINLSYGEGCALPNRGRFIELAEELVRKYGIIFVSSAGNNGPCLSTVGAPGGTSDALIGVSAFVSQAMAKAMYNVRTKDVKTGEQLTLEEGSTYAWSSVGPTADGSVGVDITAPGGAITCVPNWSLQKCQLMNGTSMSAPNVAGCIALLLSAAKAEGIKVTSARVKHAIDNSAKVMDGLTCLQQGSGMIQVEKAWDYLKQYKDDSFQDITFKVNIISRPGHPRGVYLRQPQDVIAKQTFTINVNALFASADYVEIETQLNRVEFEMKFALQSTAPWVQAPEHFMLMHNGRSFQISVDPTKLDVGVHTAKILAYDSNMPEAGPRFSVPITVLKPLTEKPSLTLGKLEFTPSEVKRHFLNVPKGATWMDVTTKDCREAKIEKDLSSRQLILHTVQMLSHRAYRDAEVKRRLNFSPSQEIITSIPVHPGITCELALARDWSAVGTPSVEVSVSFRGVSVNPTSLTITGGGGGARAQLMSNMKDEYILPSAKLTTWRTPISPISEGLISPCDERDILITGSTQIYQLVLTYEFEQKEPGNITPLAPALQGYLYDSGFESQLMLVFDKDKRYLGASDSWPGEVKVPKGKISIRLQIRHDDVKKLEKLKDLSIWIQRKLSKVIPLSAYATHNSMVVSGPSFKRRFLSSGSSIPVFLKEPASSDLPTECKCGDILMGSSTFVDVGKNLPGLGREPGGGYPVKFFVGNNLKKKDKKVITAKTPELPDERKATVKMEETIRSLKVVELNKLLEKSEDDAEAFEEVYEMFLQEFPDHIPLLMTRLKFYDSKDRREKLLNKIIDSANAVIDLVDESDLAMHFGTIYDKDDPKSCKQRKDMEEEKVFLTEALARKARAVGDILQDDNGADAFEEALKHLKKWEKVDASNKKLAVLILQKDGKARRFGSQLKLINELLKNDGDDTKGGICPMSKIDLLEKRTEVLKYLDYSHLVERNKQWKAISSSKDYSPF